MTTDTVTGNQYLYDPEGRICAVRNNFGGMTGYLYDAEGTRIAKGTVQNMTSCDPTANGFQLTSAYVVGPSGEQLAEAEQDADGDFEWQHTNVWAGGTLLATYQVAGPSIPNPNDPGNPFPNSTVHFYFDDPLGTRRAQTDFAGVVEQTCVSLPYGDGESCIPVPTEHLFTGKERDTESGNDYFGARYYAAAWAGSCRPTGAKIAGTVCEAGQSAEPQSVRYVLNNPLTQVDPDGHVLNCVSNPSQCGSDLNKIAPGTKVAADGTVQKGSLLQRIWNHLDGHGDGQSLVSSLVSSRTVTGINPNAGDANGGTSRPGVITYDPAGASITTRNTAGQLAAGWAKAGAPVPGHELIHEYHRENGGTLAGNGGPRIHRRRANIYGALASGRISDGWFCSFRTAWGYNRKRA